MKNKQILLLSLLTLLLGTLGIQFSNRMVYMFTLSFTIALGGFMGCAYVVLEWHRKWCMKKLTSSSPNPPTKKSRTARPILRLIIGTIFGVLCLRLRTVSEDYMIGSFFGLALVIYSGFELFFIWLLKRGERKSPDYQK